jgi:hypothetical protein
MTAGLGGGLATTLQNLAEQAKIQAARSAFRAKKQMDETIERMNNPRDIPRIQKGRAEFGPLGADESKKNKM